MSLSCSLHATLSLCDRNRSVPRERRLQNDLIPLSFGRGVADSIVLNAPSARQWYSHYALERKRRNSFGFEGWSETYIGLPEGAVSNKWSITVWEQVVDSTEKEHQGYLRLYPVHEAFALLRMPKQRRSNRPQSAVPHTGKGCAKIDWLIQSTYGVRSGKIIRRELWPGGVQTLYGKRVCLMIWRRYNGLEIIGEKNGLY